LRAAAEKSGGLIEDTPVNNPEWLAIWGWTKCVSVPHYHIDPQLLLRLTARDLKEMGVARWHTRKIIDAIGELAKQAVHSAHPAMAPSELGTRRGAPEREWNADS